MMGSPWGELSRNTDESEHSVHLTRNFAIGKYEVTQGEFNNLMKYNPSYHKLCGANCPVEQVSWHQAVEYTNALSKNRGLEECFTCTGVGNNVNCNVQSQYNGNNYYNCKGYRLPTEAEWEYAYRAGTNTAFYNGKITKTGCDKDPVLDDIGWYCTSSIYQVGKKKPNAWGLYDIAGNVWEWVYDWYTHQYYIYTQDPVGPDTGTNRVYRGGGFNYFVEGCRAAFRAKVSPSNINRGVGFRVLRSL
jgi:formylglycine-generating enzyme required for sulfatase activity